VVKELFSLLNLPRFNARLVPFSGKVVVGLLQGLFAVAGHPVTYLSK